MKRDEKTLAVRLVSFSAAGVEKLRGLRGRKWHPDEKVWSIPYTLDMVERLIAAFHACTLQIEAELLDECYLLREWQHLKREHGENVRPDEGI